VNLYCCRARPDWPWREALAESFGATQVFVRTLARGVAEDVPDAPTGSSTPGEL
jgi:hypothetical protein